MQVRDRIREFRRVPARTLRPNPRNWRTHPRRQQNALRGVLAEVGYADALLVRELEDGTLELIDGHLRAETTPDMEVPVLVLDVDAQEANKLLALLDPLSGMAGTDERLLADLLREVQSESEAVQQALDHLAKRAGIPTDDALSNDDPGIELSDLYQVVVECRDEAQQRTLFEQLAAEGYKCRLVTL
ncbi:MAG TPA: ParB N-terminal domain-containing protein [Pirellulales bacterium]|jgi:hypothetical protein|nr:ParB N-terminal domain-containing protein [Pirellulales bacterium]